jgi:2-keto-4-pentenoate hydratase
MEAPVLQHAATSPASGAVAASLRAAALSAQPIAPVRDTLPERTLSCAYEVQQLNIRHSIGQGRRLSGRKIGLTSRAVQKQLGVDTPDFGMLFADMEIPHGGRIEANRLIAPKVEAEMAFVLGRPLERPDVTLDEVLESVAWVFPALEICDSRIERWDISILDTVADNASAGLYVLGAGAKRSADVDFRLAGMRMERNGEGESFGAAAACLGSPLNALRWLARVMARSDWPLRAGDVVLSGALGPMVSAYPGDHFRARIDGLGEVAVQFGGA